MEVFKWGWLRKLFGLQRPIRTEPAFSATEDGLFNMFYGNAGSWYSSQTQLENQRRAMYIDYEAMDFYPVLSGALDTFAEDASQYDIQAGASIWCVSNDRRAAEVINAMFARVLEPNLFSIARSLAKYGDCFEQVLYGDRQIEALSYVQPDLVSRVEDIYGRLLGFTPGVLEGPPYRALPGEKVPEPLSKPWDFVHFRILDGDHGTIHGRSLLNPARRVWRQLKIIEDSMVLYRLNRGPDRLVYYIDVGSMSREEQFRTVQMWRQYIRKSFHRDRKGGKFEQEYDPNTVDQDIYWPTREGSNSKVEKLQGSPNVGDIGDVEYFRDLLFSGIGIPKAYMGFEGDVNAKATLAQQDVKYARKLKKLTRALIEGAMRLAQIELVLHGINPLDERLQLEIRMTPASYLDELQRNELYSLRLELAERMLHMGQAMNFRMAKWAAFILYNYMDMSLDAIKVFLKPEGPKPEPGLGGPGLGAPGLDTPPGLGEPGEIGGLPPPEGEAPPPLSPAGAPLGPEGPAEPPRGEFGLDVAGRRPSEAPTLQEGKGRRRTWFEQHEAAALLDDRGEIDPAVMESLVGFMRDDRRLDLLLELSEELSDSTRVPVRANRNAREELLELAKHHQTSERLTSRNDALTIRKAIEEAAAQRPAPAPTSPQEGEE